jgi:hypothetical protein
MWNTRRLGLEDKVIDVVSSLCTRVEHLAEDIGRNLDRDDMYYYRQSVMSGHNLIKLIEPEED